MTENLNIVIFGLTITSSWGNGHATTWRGLVQGLAARGHNILFLERDASWYADNRDDPEPAGAITVIYQSFDELTSRFEQDVSNADLVIVGSYVPEGIRVGEWVTAVARGRCVFYDIDTPITISSLETGGCEYINTALVRRYDAYLSFTGGPTLRKLESKFGSPMARTLYCSVDQQKYYPTKNAVRWDLGYLGTYSADRQSSLVSLLLAPADLWPEGRFAVAGPQYSDSQEWPKNVTRFTHLAPSEHAAFYGSQRFTLNITRAAMRATGYSPSVRLFEAGACGTPIISDWWEGLDSIFSIGDEVLVAENSDDTLRYLRDLTEEQRIRLGQAARRKILAEHTPAARILQIELYFKEMNDQIPLAAARRNRSTGKDLGRVSTGMSPQPGGTTTGSESGNPVGPVTDRRNLHQSVGAGTRNGRTNSGESQPCPQDPGRA